MNRLERRHEQRLEARLRRGVCSFDIGGDAPKPDPAIGEAAKANSEIGRDALAFSKEQYADQKALLEHYRPMIDRVLDQQIRLGDKSEAASDDYLGYMKSTFRPIEQSLAKEATEFDTEAKRAELAGKAGADVEQAAGAADAAARRNAARYGINPSDAAFSENLAGNALNKTIAKVGAMSQARTQARSEGRALKFDVAGIGRNLPAAGATSAGLALNAGNAAVGTAGASQSMNAAAAAPMYQGYSTAVGANNSAGGLYSNIFQGRMQGYQADQEAMAGLYQGIGMLGGLAMKSSRKMKTKKGDVSAEAVAAKVATLPVDRWAYKRDASPDGAEHIGTYAEDFKKHFGVGDGKTISVIDAVGVTMAAVKGAMQKIDRLENQMARHARNGIGRKS